MQTFTIQVQDSFMPEFLSYIDKRKSYIHIEKDKNLEYDPYFYGRKRELENIRADIKSGEIKMITQEQYKQNIEDFFKELEENNAN